MSKSYQERRNENFLGNPTVTYLSLKQYKKQILVSKPNWLSNYGKPRGLAGLPHSGGPDYNEIGKENNRHNHFATQ